MGRSSVDYPLALLLALAVVVSLVLVFAGTTSPTAFGAYNPTWNGVSTLRADAGTTDAGPATIRSDSRFATLPRRGSLVVVVSPNRPYTAADVGRIAAFVNGGGTLLVADDYGRRANRLLSRLGANASIDGRPVRDERFDYRSPAFPIANDVSNRSLVANVSGLTLNHGSVVRPNGATVLVATSSYAYLDVNRNGRLDNAETLANYPVATTESLGSGRVVVVSDPSIFINAMLDRPGNAAFVRALVDVHRRVFLDTSHTAAVPPLVALHLTLRESPVVQLLAGVAGLLTIALVSRRRALRSRLPDRLTGAGVPRPDAVSPEDLIARVLARHPDWDDELVGRVVRRRLDRTRGPTDDRDERPRSRRNRR